MQFELKNIYEARPCGVNLGKGKKLLKNQNLALRDVNFRKL